MKLSAKLNSVIVIAAEERILCASAARTEKPQPLRLPAKYSKQTAKVKRLFSGNIGIPITEHASETRPGDTVVAETAALQLESIRDFHADAAGLLNITEDHINRFGSMEAYIAAKMRIFENQTEQDFAVLMRRIQLFRPRNKSKKALLFKAA